MKIIKKYLKALFGTVVLVVAFSLVDKEAILQSVKLVSFIDVLVLLLLSVVLTLVSVEKWRLFLVHLQINTSRARLISLYLIGYFVNLIMPSHLGGDIVRALAVGEKANRTAAFSATFLERYTGLAAMLLLAQIAVFLPSIVTTEIRLCVTLIFIFFIAGSLAFSLKVVSYFLSLKIIDQYLSRNSLLQKIASVTVSIEGHLRSGLSSPLLLVKVGLLSLIFHCLTVVNTAAVAYAVGWESVPWLDLFVVLPLILLVGAIPIAPQGLGIQEGAFLYFLTGIGATPAQAISIGLVLRAKSYFLAFLGWILTFFEKKGGLLKPDPRTVARNNSHDKL